MIQPGERAVPNRCLPVHWRELCNFFPLRTSPSPSFVRRGERRVLGCSFAEGAELLG
jgi:hypothetical protein